MACDVYNDELLNMREVLENFKHRQKWRPLSCGRNNKGGENKFSPGLDESEDLGSLSIQHHSVTEIVRFVTEMTDLCIRMDEKKSEIDFYDTCIRDINEERITFSSTDETDDRLKCYAVARNNALKFFNMSRVFAVVKFIKSRNTNAFEGNMVENTLDTLYLMDDEKSQANALRDTVQNVLAKGVEQLRQTEVDLHKEFYKYETTKTLAEAVVPPPPPPPPTPTPPPTPPVLSTFAELPESNVNVQHALSAWHHQ